MLKLTKIIIFVLVCSQSFSQSTFLDAMNSFKASNYFETNSPTYPTNNLDGVLVDRSYEMEALLVMYKQTNDPAWLKLFVKHADKVINARDDKQVGYTQISNYLGNIEPTWVSSAYTNGQKVASIYHTGMLTYPLAEFCHIISQNTALFQGINANNVGGVFYTTQNLVSIANDLMLRVNETLNVHNDEWFNSILPNNSIGGQFRFDCDQILFTAQNPNQVIILTGGSLPLNQQAAIGKTYLYMFLATPSSNPLKNQYKERVIRIANTLRFNMVNQTSANSAHYLWRYWDVVDHPPQSNYTNDCMAEYADSAYLDDDDYEDMFHTIIDVSFAYLCYKNNIPFSMASGSGLCFDSIDMTKIATTLKNMYYDPMKYYDFVNRTGDVTYQNYNFSYPDSLSGLAHWLMYSEFDKDIYQMISEISTKYALNSVLPSWPGVLGIAYSHMYRKELNPIDLGQGGASSAWAGAAIGDFNGDGIKDVATLRNGDGDIFLYRWGFNSALNRYSLLSGQTLFYPSTSQWRGIAIGDLDGQPGDEVAAIRNIDNKIFVWKNTGTGSTINMVAWKEISVAPATNWAGITIGNFDNSDPSSEIAVVSNSTGATYVYDYNGTNFILKSTKTNGSASQWAGIASGNFDNDTRDEIVLARNFDGDIFIYKLNSSNVINSVSSFNAPSNMDWKGLTAGDYDMDGCDEICIHARSDGDLYIFKLTGSILNSIKRIQFVGPVNGRYLENSVLTSGNLTSNSGCCSKDEILNMRNSDGWHYIYEVNIGGQCSIPSPCSSPSSMMSSGISSSSNSGKTERQLTVYPNPSSTELFVDFSLFPETISDLTLYDSSGKLIKIFNLSELSNDNKLLRLEVNEIENGIYFLNANNSSIHKIIIVR